MSVVAMRGNCIFLKKSVNSSYADFMKSDLINSTLGMGDKAELKTIWS